MIATDTTHQVNIDGAHMVVTHGRDVGLPEPESVGVSGHIHLHLASLEDARAWCEHAMADDGPSLYTYSSRDGDIRRVCAWGTVMGTRVSLQWSEAVEVAR